MVIALSKKEVEMKETAMVGSYRSMRKWTVQSLGAIMDPALEEIRGERGSGILTAAEFLTYLIRQETAAPYHKPKVSGGNLGRPRKVKPVVVPGEPFSSECAEGSVSALDGPVVKTRKKRAKKVVDPILTPEEEAKNDLLAAACIAHLRGESLPVCTPSQEVLESSSVESISEEEPIPAPKKRPATSDKPVNIILNKNAPAGTPKFRFKG